MEKIPQDKSAPSNPQPTTSGKPEARTIKFVIVRDGYRVSEKEYDSPTDPVCVAEIAFWRNVSNNSSHGEKVEAVQFDSKKH